MTKKHYVISIFTIVIIALLSFYYVLNNDKDVKDRKLAGYIENDFKIKNILIFDTKYEQLIEILGQPLKTTNITDETIISHHGYFVILHYEGMNVTIDAGVNFDLKNGTVTEIDITDKNITTFRGVTVNETFKKIKQIYGIKEKYPLNSGKEKPLADMKIQGLKRGNEQIDLETYTDYCYFTFDDKPIAMIFLLDNDVVKKIVVRNLTAD
ncbi:hypothetical protein PV797_11725 [Clostridiaceae bacterium M8S5]|nr:hypothetical protein PV797_11725 [Clostridiaceae bacterium M8S5]